MTNFLFSTVCLTHFDTEIVTGDGQATVGKLNGTDEKAFAKAQSRKEEDKGRRLARLNCSMKNNEEQFHICSWEGGDGKDAWAWYLFIEGILAQVFWAVKHFG